MNPSTGTFTTMDTYQGSVFDPVSLHKYLYANANPVMNVDPSGYNTLPDLEAGEAGEVPLEEASSISSKFAHTVWRSVITGTVFGGLDAYRQWRTTGKIDWGHVFDTFVITSAASVFFGVSYILGSAMQSTMILTALGGSSVIFAGAGLAQAVADGRAGKFDLVLIDLVFVGAAVKGAKSCYDSTVKIASAKNTAKTVTVPVSENTNSSSGNVSTKSPIFGDEWYRHLQYKYGAEKVEWNINSFEDIGRHPTSLRGYSADEVGRILGEGWTRGVYGRNGSGWKYTQDAHPNNSVFYHGGGGEHGGAYWGVSYNNIKIKVVDTYTYISTPNDDALIIFSEDW